MMMDSELQLQTALNFLANGWRNDPELRQSFERVFETLEAGTSEDRASADRIRSYLSYPGCDEALGAALRLHSALRTTQGRRAADLPPRKKGRSYPAEMVTLDDEILRVLINHELGAATSSEVDNALTDYIGLEAAPATRKKFISELRPRAVAYARFLKKFFDAARSIAPL